MDVGRLGIVVLGGDAFTVVKGQLVDGVDVSAYERVGFPFVEGVAFGLGNGLIQRIMVVGGRGRVLDLPAVVGDVAETYRTDLDVDGRAFVHCRRCQVVHVAEIFELVRSCGDRPLQASSGARAGAFTVFDNDGVTVRGSSVVVCFDHLVAVEVIQRQFGDSIYVSPDFGMRFPVVEVVTFGFERRVHAVIVLCRGHGVFNIPAFEVEAFVSYRADLDEDGGSVIHGSGLPGRSHP